MSVDIFWTDGVKMKAIAILFVLLIVLVAGYGQSTPAERPTLSTEPALAESKDIAIQFVWATVS